MPNSSHRFKVTALAAAIMAVHSLSAFAQDSTETEATTEDDALVEEVVVTGIRAAIQRSIDDKKLGSNIKDTINAEDMGKTTDQNIADSLGRVTGVTVVSRNGEGSQITIRGAAASQNNISLNGQQLTSTEFSQEVDLSAYSSDILSKLEVVKTPSADHDEGSLGGSVNLVTTRPLDLKDNVRSISLQGRWNDLSEEDNYKIQGSISHKFLEETIGVSATLVNETNDYRRDEYYVTNFVARTLPIAVDQNGNTITDFVGIAPQSINYELSENSSDRTGLTLGVQWAPTSQTELMFDTSYSVAESKQNSSAIRTRLGARADFVEGVSTADGSVAPFTDPTRDWNIVDTRTYDVVKHVGRFNQGDFINRIDGSENTNLASSLKVDHEFFDSFRMSALVGYSSSKQEQLPNAYINTQNFNNVTAQTIVAAGRNIEPVGFDCTQGDLCRMVTGVTPMDFGDIIYDSFDPVVVSNVDNVVYSGFVPQDTSAQHMAAGNLTQNDRTVEDTMSNAQVDFDWDVDVFGLTTLEFGAKVTAREKYVDDQQYRFQSIAKTIAIRDENGQIIQIPSDGFLSVRGDQFSQGEIGSGDFMESLGFARDHTTTNWERLDAKAALDLAIGDDQASRVNNKSRTRTANIDTQAAYLKANFNFFDDRLSGDFGVRYVKTEVESQSFSGIELWERGEPFMRMMNAKKLYDLRNTDNPPCEGHTAGDAYTYDYAAFTDLWATSKFFERADGTGFDTNNNPDPSTWVRDTVDQGPCHLPNFIEAIAQGTGDFITTNNPTVEFDWLHLQRHTDLSTAPWAPWTDPSYDISQWRFTGIAADDTTRVWNIGNVIDGRSAVTGRNLFSTPTEDTHSYSNVLPSLNLNFVISEDWIARFAASQTITRPEIDLLRAGIQLRDTEYWGGETIAPGRISRFNTKLEPLKSNNLDLSFEWYFDEGAMLSAALFSKKMSDFVGSDLDTNGYVQDPRGFDETSTIDPETFILDANNLDIETCLPKRFLSTVVAQEIRDSAQRTSGFSPILSDAPQDICGRYEINSVVNGAGASVKGMELGYSQSYDFLPGYILSGLGLQANYTYQESAYDRISANEIEYPVADTPEHTYNMTAFWEQDGHQLRLSYRGASDSLVNIDYRNGIEFRGRNWREGSLWNEGRDTLDLAATWAINDIFSLSAQAINLTDASYRQYYTSRVMQVVPGERMNAEGEMEPALLQYQEGDPTKGNAPTHRTYSEYKVGTSYRLELRIKL